jgi:hypothetical protein
LMCALSGRRFSRTERAELGRELKAIAKGNSIELEQGDVALVRTGYLSHWPDTATLEAHRTCPDRRDGGSVASGCANPLNACAPRRRTNGHPRRSSYGRARRYARRNAKSTEHIRTYGRDRRRCRVPRAARRTLLSLGGTDRSGPVTADGPERVACPESDPLPRNRSFPLPDIGAGRSTGLSG